MKLPDKKKLARGQDCMFNIVGHCNYDPSTVVFCHDRKHSQGGVGYKGKDAGAFGCSACHDILDRRVKVDCLPDDFDFYWRRGHARMAIWWDDYLKSWLEEK